ncbi:prepilin peptidase [Nakamurella antarctica]|uniref:Prepilin peptidase n=1 Tax=Nakamurella antarctica TaxID=1902245 RepID=A0A3G8ZUQ9_9ACTN|nr:A24 family peptidase [Nakamurella antarctica]AZI57756.1 prepilin peptidase [Nakamurella antarctica]
MPLIGPGWHAGVVMGENWLVAGIVAAAAIPAGVGIRELLRRLRRGAVFTAGPIEAACALVCGGAALILGPSALLPVTLWAGLLAVALSAVDLTHHRLPDAITLSAFPITAVILVATTLVTPGAGDLARAGIASAVVGGAFCALAYGLPVAMGRGDAKLAFTLGLLLGYQSWLAVIFAIMLAFLLGAVVGLAGMAAGRMTAKSALPFGPFLLLGTLVAMVAPSWIQTLLS